MGRRAVSDERDDEIALLRQSIEKLAAKVDAVALDMADLKGRFRGGWLVVAVLGSLITAAAGAFAAFRAHT
jgi:hypothetical protein